ncbi:MULTISPECIES: metal ABC transporter substrate-binding protein [Lacticaseibacillus]|uniref:Manganese ABC transporter substrate-binding protein n=2 Tax=Lacticaseibacillus TaxID=2759736 RepID=A0AAN1C6B7_LACCA|nr:MULTISPECIES: metal ABC transporter substrate-binding protein [Lacticaseibacillus]ARY90533.1 manganese ABC transporter substrate-binding protein [Lacticaseibacillus casei]KAB1970391.1 metal ABC transporter substrate-binding protein [Lacticaseibacillus casei]WLV81150.1 metal ABC transporter substrate-binding protein [Lacticaseibacillus sp. NCIMB 15473]WNX25110.1 metal ABC transporter substrate-binding protein [Lacticaseibacillus casei]WNX27881.1 metal ABC transporter substrate-binding protei
MKNKNRKRVLVQAAIVVTALIGLTACGSKSKSSDKAAPAGSKISIVATDTIIGDIAKNVAKDKAKIHVIVPVGQDPHEYDPLPADVSATGKADAIFYNGINLENAPGAWFTKMMNNEGSKAKAKAVAVSDGVDVIHLQGKGESSKQDPHAWLSLANGMIYTRNIAKKLEKVDPKNAAFYKRNAATYEAKLNKLHQSAKNKFDKIPAEKKLIVTSEGCFKYFSKAYQIPSAYIWEINTEEEGTPEQISTLVRKLKETKTPSLFVESSVNPKPMQTVSKDTGIPIYATLFTDSIASPGKTGDSYYGMMKWNLEKIAAGLEK